MRQEYKQLIIIGGVCKFALEWKVKGALQIMLNAKSFFGTVNNSHTTSLPGGMISVKIFNSRPHYKQLCRGMVIPYQK